MGKVFRIIVIYFFMPLLLIGCAGAGELPPDTIDDMPIIEPVEDSNNFKVTGETYTIIHEKNGSIYSIALENDENYMILVFDKESNLVQSIYVDWFVGVDFQDVNTDGYMDIIINTGGTWNETHDLYVWDPMSNNFIKAIYEGFEMLAWFTVHDGYIENFIRGSAPDDSVLQKLIWNGNILKLEQEQ